MPGDSRCIFRDARVFRKVCLSCRFAPKTKRRMIEAIFWDNDGVLVDTEALFFEANRELLAEHGIALDHDTFAEWSLRRGVSVFEILENKTDEERLALRDERNRRYVSTLRKGVDVFEGVEGCLAELYGQLPMAVVTSAYPDHFEVIHAQTNLMQYFEFALRGGDYARHKPFPDPYLDAAKRLDVDPTRCLVIEDSERGLVSAVAAGMRCIVVPNPLARDADLSSAHRVIDSVAEIPTIVSHMLREA